MRNLFVNFIGDREKTLKNASETFALSSPTSRTELHFVFSLLGK